MAEIIADTWTEAIELALNHGKAVTIRSSEEERRCNRCESYQQLGMTACEGCCGR